MITPVSASDSVVCAPCPMGTTGPSVGDLGALCLAFDCGPRMAGGGVSTIVRWVLEGGGDSVSP